MKLHKRLLTWIIAMLLILSLLPVQIFASEVPLADELPDITEEVQLTEEEPLTDTPIAEEVLEEEISLQEEEPAGIVLEAEGDISLEVVNNVGMFKPEAVSITTGEGSNVIHLTMGSASMDAVFVGYASEATDAAAIPITIEGEKGYADIPVASIDKPIVLAFHSASRQTYYNRTLTIDLEKMTATFDPTAITVEELEGMDTEEAIAHAKDLATVELVDALIEAIQVQARDENTDKYCAIARAYYDALSGDDKDKLADPGYFGDDTGDASKDDPRNQDEIGEKELLVVSFGTSFNDNRVATIKAVEDALAAAYPDYSVRRAFTAQIIINHIQARDGEVIDNMDQALERAIANGVKKLVVQPTHLMHGAEYDEMCETLSAYEDKFDEIHISEPLLSSAADKEIVAKAAVDEAVADSEFDSLDAAAQAKTALVFMGHGTAHEANVTYNEMQDVMTKLGYSNVFIGTVEGEPEETEVNTVLAKVKEAGYEKVILRPLMVVAGDHANNDMAGDEEDSWKSIFGADLGAANVACQVNGLGEIKDVQQLYVDHVKDATTKLSINNTTGMFKAVSASLETVDGKTELVMALSGSGYHEMFKGTYEQAVANGDNTDNWIHGATNAEGKWEFRIPLEDDETYVPLVAISDSYYQKYLNGQNSLARAFYPRQLEVDRGTMTLTTGDYEFYQEIAVTNNVKMFNVEDTAVLHTVGGPNSNNYKADLELLMGSDSFDKAFYGTAEEAAAAESTLPITERALSIPVKWVETFGQPETMKTLIGEDFTVSFHSVNKDAWYERVFNIDEEAGTLVINEPGIEIDELADMDTEEAIARAEELATVELVNALIEAIQVQTRDENTDKYCAIARAFYDALSDDDKEKLDDPGYFGDDTGDASKDDPRNQDEIGEKELLVVSFGTSFNDNRVATIKAVEDALAEAYPDYSVRRAFTAQIIINHIQARDGEVIDNMDQALERAIANGVKTLVVQPTHLMHGAEYDEMCKTLSAYEDKFDEIIISEPLLSSDEDKEIVAKAAVDEAVADSEFDSLDAAAQAKTALVFMGHGTAHEANVTYNEMQDVMTKLGYSNVFIGTVEGEPEETEVNTVLAKVKEAGYEKVILRPLMVVAGDHANNDMAGDEEDSWKSIFGAELGAANVACQVNGLGEIKDVQQLYVEHVKDVLPKPLTTVSVDFTSQMSGGYLHAPQFDYEVDSNLAETYGYEDDVYGVSALDVLVAAHELTFGDDFTPETAETYLTIGETGATTKQFGVEPVEATDPYSADTFNGGFFLNYAFPNDGTKLNEDKYFGTTLTTQEVKDDDVVDFFFWESEYMGDTWNWFVDAEGNYGREFTVKKGEDLDLTLRGFFAVEADRCIDAEALAAYEDADDQDEMQIYTVDPETGALEAIDGAVTDYGEVTLNFAEAGTYYITAMSDEDAMFPLIMSLTKISVEEDITLDVVNNVKMFKPAKTLSLTTDGESGTIHLTMESASMDAVFVGYASEALDDEALPIAIEGEQGFVDIPVDSINEPIVLAFRSAKNQTYYNRTLTIDLDKKTATFDATTIAIDEFEGMETEEAIARAKELATVELVNALIEAIQVQTRDENTDKYCAIARAYYDALSIDNQEKLDDPGYFGDDTGDASKDNPRNQDEIGEKELLVVSFGTSFNDNRVATIKAVEDALAAAYPDYSVRRAFTAQIIINHIQARDGEVIDNMDQALERAIANGVKTLVIQPTHLMHGAEYDEMCETLSAYEDKFDEIIISEPLLSSDADKEIVAKAAVDEAVADSEFDSLDAAAQAKTALVFMGHGTAHEANVTYNEMQDVMTKLGYSNVFIGTVEGEPEETEVNTVLAKVKEAGYEKVILRPLMVVAGDHANNDMAGDEEDSWKSIFGAELGAENVACQVNGLGEIEDVQQLYVAHVNDAINKVEKFPYDGAEVSFIKKDGDTFGMWTPQDGTTIVRSGDEIRIHIVPKNKTIYGWMHWGAISDETLSKDVTLEEDGTINLTLSKDYCGYAHPIAPIKKKDGATTDSQYYLAIPAEELLADYTAVDAAIAKIPQRLDFYTEETAKAVTDAVEAVDYSKTPADQAEIEAMAKAIEDAVEALVEKTFSFEVFNGDEQVTDIEVVENGYDASYEDWMTGEKIEEFIPLYIVKLPDSSIENVKIKLNDYDVNGYQNYIYTRGAGASGYSDYINYGFGDEVGKDTYVAAAGKAYETAVLPEDQVYRVQTAYDENWYSKNLCAIAFELPPQIEPTSMKLNKTKISELATKKTYQLKAIFEPENATETDVTWKSSDKSIATVDANGKVTALKYGTVTITATSKANSKLKATCKIQTRFFDALSTNVDSEKFKAIYWAADHKITGETVSFGTNNSMTRGQFVRFLYRFAGNPKVSKTMIDKYGKQFKDVDKSYTHYKAIVWAVSKGLIAGYSDGTFKPNKTLSRTNVATILWKYAGSPKVSNAKKPFADVAKSAALAWGKNKKIFTGDKNNKFQPKANCLRGDFAVFLYRYNNKYKVIK